MAQAASGHLDFPEDPGSCYLEFDGNSSVKKIALPDQKWSGRDRRCSGIVVKERCPQRLRDIIAVSVIGLLSGTQTSYVAV